MTINLSQSAIGPMQVEPSLDSVTFPARDSSRPTYLDSLITSVAVWYIGAILSPAIAVPLELLLLQQISMSYQPSPELQVADRLLRQSKARQGAQALFQEQEKSILSAPGVRRESRGPSSNLQRNVGPSKAHIRLVW